jgi:hypothetical protein
MKPRERSNHAMERTADRCVFTFQMTSTPSVRATRAIVRRRLILFSLGDSFRESFVEGLSIIRYLTL